MELVKALLTPESLVLSHHRCLWKLGRGGVERVGSGGSGLVLLSSLDPSVLWGLSDRWAEALRHGGRAGRA